MIFNRCSKDFVHKTKQKKNREHYVSLWVILVPFTLQKNVVRTIFFFNRFTRVTIRLGLWLKHARNHPKARQAHMNMVRNEDAFTQSFRTAKGVQTSFFFRFCYGPKTRKKRVGSISWKRGTECLHGKNIWSVPTFLRVRAHFFL